MTNSFMRCAKKAASVAAERMSAAGEQAIQDSVAGFHSPAADKQPVTPNVADARANSLASPSSAASAAGGSPTDAKFEIEGVCSGYSVPPSNSKSSAKAGRKYVGGFGYEHC